MTNNVKLSVIVPVYNSEKYLDECIKSILNQKFKDFELILINDGSTDSSGEICNNYKEIDKRVKVIHKKNNGLSSARESGYLEACGQWITFIDNDDIIHPNMFSILLEDISDEDIEIIGGGRIDLESEDIQAYQWERESNKYDLIEGIYACDNMIEFSKKWLTIPLWGKIYRKSLLDKVDINKYKNVCPTIFFEDILLTPFLLYNSKKIKLINCVIYLHREVKSSISRSGKFTSFYAEQVESGKIILEFYKQNSLLNMYKWQLNNYYRIILRAWILLSDYNVSKNEKIKIENNIKNYFEKFYSDFINEAECSVVKKRIISLFKVNPKIWGKIARFSYSKLNIRY